MFDWKFIVMCLALVTAIGIIGIALVASVTEVLAIF